MLSASVVLISHQSSPRGAQLTTALHRRASTVPGPAPTLDPARGTSSPRPPSLSSSSSKVGHRRHLRRLSVTVGIISHGDERTLSSASGWGPLNNVSFTCMSPPIFESGLRIFLLWVGQKRGHGEALKIHSVELGIHIVDALAHTLLQARRRRIRIPNWKGYATRLAWCRKARRC